MGPLTLFRKAAKPVLADGTYYQQLCRPYANYGDVDIHYHNLNSNYNALQMMFTRQKGWLNYWGKLHVQQGIGLQRGRSV